MSMKGAGIESRVRDRLWVWGHEAGSHNMDWVDNGTLVHNWYNLPAQSRMTPAESALYLGVPNLIMVRCGNKPGPPYDTLAQSFAPLRRVVWSVIGDSSTTANNGATDLDEVLRLADRYPNISGAIMDDMNPSRLGLDQLKAMHAQLKGRPHPLDLWIVLYAHELNPDMQPYYAESDLLALWTWKQEDLAQLPAHLDRVEAAFPNKRKVLGCYLYDYGNRRPMTEDNMRRQCEWGLKWLQDGRIEGMIFLANCVCDLGLDAVEWTRQWIADHGDDVLAKERLPGFYE